MPDLYTFIPLSSIALPPYSKKSVFHHRMNPDAYMGAQFPSNRIESVPPNPKNSIFLIRNRVIRLFTRSAGVPSDVPSRLPAIQSLFVSDWPRRIAGRQHGLDDCARLVQCFFAARSNVFACRDSSDFARGLRHGGQFDAGGHIRSVVPGHGHVFQPAHRAVRFQEQDTYNPFCAVEVCFDVDVPHDGCILSLY